MYLSELLYGISNVIIYFVIAVSAVLLLRLSVSIYDELFRKILHFVLLGSIYVWTVSFHTWWLEAVTVIGFVIIVYPVLAVLGRLKNFTRFTTERKTGELKSSLVIVFSMFALVITVSQGIFKDNYVTLAAIYAWGVGDAFAALIGKRFGKHKIKGRYLSGKKSIEGSLAMFLASFTAVLTILMIRDGLSISALVWISAVTAAVSTVCELYTENGMDTLTCPLASLITLLCLLFFAGGL